MYIIYGIPNCDTIKKTLAWFQKNQVPYEFHDYKKKGITQAKLKAWSKQAGWEKLLNKKGTTWRQLNEATQVSITNEAKAVALMNSNTSIIKRPVIEQEGKVVLVGFDEAALRPLLQ